MLMRSRSSNAGEKNPIRKSYALIAATLAAGFVLGWFFGNRGDSGSELNPAPRSEGGSPGSSPADQSQDGAVAAATTYIQIMTAPSAEKNEYHQAMLDLAAPEWKHRAAELADNTIDFVQDRYGEGAELLFQPIRYRVISYSESEASIDIWGVLLGSGPKLGGIEESWATGTLRLVWVENQWKVLGQSSRGGPTPEPVRSDGPAAVPSEVEEFEEYEHAPRP